MFAAVVAHIIGRQLRSSQRRPRAARSSRGVRPYGSGVARHERPHLLRALGVVVATATMSSAQPSYDRRRRRNADTLLLLFLVAITTTKPVKGQDDGIDACNSSPCPDFSSCVDGDDGYTCDYHPGVVLEGWSCDPEGSWLGSQSAISCAASCSGYDYFTQSTHTDNNCKCCPAAAGTGMGGIHGADTNMRIFHQNPNPQHPTLALAGYGCIESSSWLGTGDTAAGCGLKCAAYDHFVLADGPGGDSNCKCCTYAGSAWSENWVASLGLQGAVLAVTYENIYRNGYTGTGTGYNGQACSSDSDCEGICTSSVCSAIPVYLDLKTLQAPYTGSTIGAGDNHETMLYYVSDYYFSGARAA